MEHIFFKDGDYVGAGGFFIRSNVKNFFKVLKEQGLNPVGLKIDDESFNLEVIVEKNEAYNRRYDNGEILQIDNGDRGE